MNFIKKFIIRFAIDFTLEKLQDLELRNELATKLNKKVNVPGLDESHERKLINGISQAAVDVITEFLTEYKSKL